MQRLFWGNIVAANKSSRERSYGIIPLKKIDSQWHVLLIKHSAGHWAFPKGHAEKGEKPIEAAQRELLEETGLSIVKFFDHSPLEESYCFKINKKLINKTVHYYLAEVSGEVKIQKEELADSQWIKVDEATLFVTFSATKHLCLVLSDLLKKSI